MAARLLLSLLLSTGALIGYWIVCISPLMMLSIISGHEWIRTSIFSTSGRFSNISLIITGPLGWQVVPLFLAAFLTGQLILGPREMISKSVVPATLLVGVWLIHSIGMSYILYTMELELGVASSLGNSAIGYSRHFSELFLHFANIAAGTAYTIIALWASGHLIGRLLEKKSNDLLVVSGGPSGNEITSDGQETLESASLVQNVSRDDSLANDLHRES